jgi:hypothetical protein
MRRVIVAMGVLALAGCTAAAEQSQSRRAEADRDLADALEGRVAGEAVDCISTTTLSGPQIIDNDTVLYRSGSRVYRNEIVGQCPRLERFNTMVVEVYGSQLCRNDRFRVVEPGTSIPGPYCRFGKFVPYTKPD